MSDEQTLLQNIGSNGWLITTIIFLMLIFVMGIVNAIFFIRIYNQSKDRDSGTGINGLSVTGSVVIGVISIIISVIAFGWALYLISKRYKITGAITEWYNKQIAKKEYFKRSREAVSKAFNSAFSFFRRQGKSKEEAAREAQAICREMNWTPPMGDGIEMTSM